MTNTAKVINFPVRNTESENEYVKADLDNGYTRLANTLFEALASNPAKLAGREYQVFCAIVLKTYRFHKKTDWIAQSQIVEITGISKSNVSDLIKSLINKCVVIKSGRNIGVNPVISEWKQFSNPRTKVLESKNSSSPIQEQKFSNSTPTIRKKLIHKNINNITCALTAISPVEKTKPTRIKKPQAFKDFFSLYPAHRRGGSDAQAWKVWKSEKLTDQDSTDVINWLTAAAQSNSQWRTDANGQFVFGITRFIRERLWLTPVPIAQQVKRDINAVSQSTQAIPAGFRS